MISQSPGIRMFGWRRIRLGNTISPGGKKYAWDWNSNGFSFDGCSEGGFYAFQLIFKGLGISDVSGNCRLPLLAQPASLGKHSISSPWYLAHGFGLVLRDLFPRSEQHPRDAVWCKKENLLSLRWEKLLYHYTTSLVQKEYCATRTARIVFTGWIYIPSCEDTGIFKRGSALAG